MSRRRATFRRCVQVIERLGCDFVRTDHVQVRGRQRLLHRTSHAPRGVVCPARSGIGPAGQRSSVDAPYAWAGIYDRRLLDEGLLCFDEDLRTCEDRPWIWGLHLHARTFALVGLHGVRYRRDVSASLTQLGRRAAVRFHPGLRADRAAGVRRPRRRHTAAQGSAFLLCCALPPPEPAGPLPTGTTAHTALPRAPPRSRTCRPNRCRPQSRRWTSSEQLASRSLLAAA